uniref:C2H2-type domain-containing protein n=1 Tax=Phlebotomus papatasi TaxID=29031 RepID=A0A1B0DHN2_PHLPP
MEVREMSNDSDDVTLHSPDIQETEEIDQEQRTESPKIAKKRRNANVQGTLEWQKRDNKNRPFTCNICNRSFTLASTLSLHTRRTHLGIRPYECAECGWKFGQSSDLTKHMRKHTGDRPYKCETCGMSFSQLRNLK